MPAVDMLAYTHLHASIFCRSRNNPIYSFIFLILLLLVAHRNQVYPSCGLAYLPIQQDSSTHARSKTMLHLSLPTRAGV